jgi:hypothetical protein
MPRVVFEDRIVIERPNPAAVDYSLDPFLNVGLCGRSALSIGISLMISIACWTLGKEHSFFMGLLLTVRTELARRVDEAFEQNPLSGDVLYPKQVGGEWSFFEGVIKLRVSRDKG